MAAEFEACPGRSGRLRISSSTYFFIINNKNTAMALKEISSEEKPSIVEEVKEMIEEDPEMFKKLSYK